MTGDNPAQNPSIRQTKDGDARANIILDFPVEYWKELGKTYSRERNADSEPILGQFGRLQRLNITHLLNTLASIKAAIKCNESTTPEQMSLLREVMHQYGRHVSNHWLRKWT